jgi:hypothetical protein
MQFWNTALALPKMKSTVLDIVIELAADLGGL